MNTPAGLPGGGVFLWESLFIVILDVKGPRIQSEDPLDRSTEKSYHLKLILNLN